MSVLRGYVLTGDNQERVLGLRLADVLPEAAELARKSAEAARIAREDKRKFGQCYSKY